MESFPSMSLRLSLFGFVNSSVLMVYKVESEVVCNLLCTSPVEQEDRITCSLYRFRILHIRQEMKSQIKGYFWGIIK